MLVKNIPACSGWGWAGGEGGVVNAEESAPRQNAAHVCLSVYLLLNPKLKHGWSSSASQGHQTAANPAPPP